MTRFWPVLHELAYSKRNCLEMVMAAGIDIPVMYRLGYRNNNCVGCVKGQAGYWNKIRKDFPERFAEMAKIERELGRQICKRERRHGRGKRSLERVWLDELPLDLGDYADEPDISCGVLCQSAG